MADPDKTPDLEETARINRLDPDEEVTDDVRESATAETKMELPRNEQPAEDPARGDDAGDAAEADAEPHEMTTRPDNPPAKAPQWEVLMREERPDTLAGGQPPHHHAPPSPRLRQWGMIARASVPIAVLVVYAVLKLSDGFGDRGLAPEVEQQVSLSGVKPDREEVRIDRETEALLARLEALREDQRWADIRSLVQEQPEEMRGHPFVRAFHAIARAESGEISGDLLAELDILENQMAGGGRSESIRAYLQLMQAQVLLASANEPIDLLRNADEYLRLVGQQPRLTPRVLEMRLDLARKYFTFGQRLDREAGTGLRVDKVQLQEARLFYQIALRWLTVPSADGWAQLQPIANGSAAQMVERVRAALIAVNRRYHGPVLPFTSSDAATWTGKVGDPIHYQPQVRP